MTAPLVAILNNQIFPYRIPLFQELHARGNIRPIVIYSARRSPDRQWSLDDYQIDYPYKILRGFSVQLPKPNYGESRTIWLNPTLLWELIRLHPDVIIAYEYSVPAMIALLYSRIFRLRCKFITWTDMTGYAERNLTRGQRLTRKISDRGSHAHIGTNYEVTQNLIARGNPSDSVFLAPQPLDVAKFRAEARRLRPESAEHPPTVIYVGYLNERKGVRHLVAAFPMVIQKIKNAQLLLIGSGPLQNEIRAQIDASNMDNNVTLAGFVEPSDLPKYYAQADVFVLPTLEDVFGVVVTEAIASQLGLVCSKYAGVASHLTDGENALIIDPQDHEQLANRLITLLTDAPLREKLIENSQSVLEQFSPQHVAACFEKAVEFALNE